jgi:transcriptional regulator with XRE-family HTH domain
MATATRALAFAARRASRHMRELGEAFLEQRLVLGLSQQHVAKMAGIEQPRYGRIERAELAATVIELDRIATVLGLDLSMRAYPGGPAVRDAPQARRLAGFLAHVGVPLRYRVEVGLPARDGGYEQRAWDAMLFGHGERTACELEMRLRDVQAMRRRHDLKRRDDPTEHFLLLIADTRHNRQVVAEFADLFHDLPRLRPGDVYRKLEAGQNPPTGLLFV